LTAPILDTNVLLRHFLEDVSDQSSRASEFIRRLATGEVLAQLPITVLFEANYVLQGTYGKTRAEILDALEPVVALPGLDIRDRDTVVRTIELYGAHNVSFADAYHAALAEQVSPPQILSFDRGISRISTVERIEP